MTKIQVLMGGLFLTLSTASFATEELGVAPQESAPVENKDDQVVSPQVKKKPSRVRRIVHDRETEGTKAPNRFETDPIIKSRYELNGQPLEVDTD